MGAYFPLFVDLSKKKIVVIGAGKIAARRIGTLLPFGGAITVIAPEAESAVQEAAQQGAVRLELRTYEKGELEKDTFFVLACTDRAEINEAVFAECRDKGIPVNVCSDRTKCDFYFPGIAGRDSLVVGVTAGGEDHRLARKITEKIKEVLKDGTEYADQTAQTEKRSSSPQNGKRDENG